MDGGVPSAARTPARHDAASAPAGPDPLAVGLEERVSRLWWLISRAAPSDLSRSAAATLARLREHSPQRIGALAAAEAVSQPTMTCVVQRLERERLVERGADPQDGRAAQISITRAGRDALDARAARRAAALGPHVDRLSAEERRTLADALRAIDTLLAGAQAR
jgi:DNA-binding MarR family transcriptional regulator